MLGERRSNSLFAPAAPAEPERKPEQAEVHDISFEECTGRSLFAETATAPRASELFFAPQEKGVTFAEALSQVQGYLSETYATLITEDNSGAKEQMKRRMARYLQENRIAVDGMTASELVDALYTEMAEYGFLTKYIFADGIEEIDINSWRDIEIQYSDGHTAKLEEHFDSPEHAANVIRRMLQNSGKVLDNASPIITSRLAKNIRISVIKTPVLDEDAGVAASIRIVNPRNLSKGDFVQSGTATEEMLDFLSACLRYGVSICVAGATSSGKTTVAGWLLSTIPDRKRIFTIEDGSRELQLIREHDGRVTNSVVHTQTRDSENERQRIDQIALLDIALRFNPDIICVGEMRGPEANAAQEAARVGIAVLTTIHSNSSEGMKKLRKRHSGEGYIDVCVLVVCAMLVLALAVRILPVFVAKQQLDTYAVELVREAEISGRVGTETNRRAAALTDSTGLDPNIRWSKTGRIQLNEEVTVTLTLDMDIGLFGGFGSFPITLRSEATGKSEVYWK